MSWSIDKARDTYNIKQWSEGFFDINEQGNISSYPNQNGQGIELVSLIKHIQQTGLSLPVLVRFTDILNRRLISLSQAFARAMTELNYHGSYTPVYPIKVNQQFRVVQTLLQTPNVNVGLEAGSKPELMAVIALSANRPTKIICNGYKDSEYIRLALIAQRLGHKVYIILENLSEVELVLQASRAMGIEPHLGLRIRLATPTTSKWRMTTGEKSKFGFSTAQVLHVIEQLRSVDLLKNLHILHFHLGSQIPNISDIQKGLTECTRYYIEMRKLNIPVHTIDVGGGLGIDYEGTRSRQGCSVNYTIQEYANNIVYTFAEMCNEHNVEHPSIVTESGRAMTAHHAVLITNIIDMEASVIHPDQLSTPNEEAPTLLHQLWESYESVSLSTALESYHDACHWITEAHAMFTHGVMTLREKAQAEQLYLAICKKVYGHLQYSIRPHREIIDEINEKLVNKYFANFSLFQSLPDSWAIDQVFPVIPLTGLQHQPTARGVIQDITCDSDGRIDYYVDSHGVETSIPVSKESLYQGAMLGIFLVGAYQEILGDLHNLFGDTDSVHVELQSDGSYRLVEPVQGDTVEDVLRYVNFNTKDLMQVYRQLCAKADIPPAEAQQYLQELLAGLHGYTYLEE